MSSFEELYTKPKGTFVQSFEDPEDEPYTTLLITRQNFNEDWHEMLEENLEEAEDILNDPDTMIFGFYNVQLDEDEELEPDPYAQFDVVLLFKHSEGGTSGPVYGLDIETAELEPWEDSFEDCGFEPLED